MQPVVTTVGSVRGVPPFLMGAEPSPQIRVVAVDGDDGFRDLLSNELCDQGFEVTAFPDNRSVLAALDALEQVPLLRAAVRSTAAGCATTAAPDLRCTRLTDVSASR